MIRISIYLVISLISIYLISISSPEPSVTSGGGNPAIILYIPSIIFIILFFKGLWTKLDCITSRNIWIGTLIIFIFTSILFTYLQYIHIKTTIIALGGSPSNEESMIYRFTWFNQYTNTFFLNFNIFIILLSILLVVKSAMNILKVK